MAEKVVSVTITMNTRQFERRARLLATILAAFATAAQFEAVYRKYNAAVADFEREIAEHIKAPGGDA